ncbi:MAG: ATP-binding protein [Bacillota bacterium]|jgi:DNA replication protein DnaC
MAQYKNFSSIKYQPDTNQTAKSQSFQCQICGDTGVVFDAEGNTHPCRCWKIKQLTGKQNRANLPRALQSMTFENFDLSYYPANEIPNLNHTVKNSYLSYAANAKKQAEEFVKSILNSSNASGIQGLMFQGQVGSGKTHLAAAIANQLISNNKQILFLVVPDFLDEIRMSYGNYGEFNELNLMNKAKNTEVLILDDLGAHNFSEWTKNKLFSLINHRINSELPMIITTNLDLNELKDILGERIISRIVAGCKPCLLPVKRDIRLTKLHR